MSVYTSGIDVGSTYTKAVILKDGNEIVSRAMLNTGFRLEEAARKAYETTLEQAGLNESDSSYLVTTGFGRHLVGFRDVNVTDINASARGAAYFIGLAVAGGIALYHYGLIRERDRAGCFKAFRHNNWFGAAVFAGIVAELNLRPWFGW